MRRRRVCIVHIVSLFPFILSSFFAIRCGTLGARCVQCIVHEPSISGITEQRIHRRSHCIQINENVFPPLKCIFVWAQILHRSTQAKAITSRRNFHPFQPAVVVSSSKLVSMDMSLCVLCVGSVAWMYAGCRHYSA